MAKKPEIVEQDGNYFRKNGNNYEPVPKVVEQDGHHFEFDPSAGDYKASIATQARPVSFAEHPLDASIEVGKEVGKKALQGLAYVGEKVDRVTGAPVRSAILAGMKGESPLSAYMKQFGRNTETAPTGKDIASLSGISNEQSIQLPTVSKYLGKIDPDLGKYFETVSPAGVAGFGIDVVADPLNFIAPEKLFSKVASLGGEVVSKGGKLAAKGLARGADLAFGTDLGSKSLELATKGGEVIENASRGVAEGIRQFSDSKIDQGYEKVLKTVAENDLPLDKLPHEFKYGPADAISRLSKKIRETPTGAKELKDYYEFGEAVGRKIDEKILEFSGGIIPKNTAEAGDVLVNGYEKGVQDFFSSIDVAYKTPARKLETLLPGATLELNENATKNLGESIQAFNESELRRAEGALDPNSRAMAKQNMVIGDLLSKRLGTYESAVDALRELGQIAFSATSRASDAVSYDKKGLRDLYFKLSEGIVDTARTTFGEKMSNSLIENNKKIHEFLKEKALVADVIESQRLAPEKIFNRLIMNGDSMRAKVLVGILPPEELKQVRGAFLENLVSRKIDDKLPLASLKKALDRKDPVASILFTPDELGKFGDLVELGNGLGDAVMSKSGTGASIAFDNLPKSVAQGVIDRSVREQLIKRAEGAAKAASNTTPPEIISTTSKVIPKRESISRFLTRGPRESLLKSGQVLSNQNQNNNKDTDAISRRLRGR